MKLLVMIPTYNEKENVANLVEQIFSLKLPPDDTIRIVIVDDNSPDGTGKIADELAKRYSQNIHVIHRFTERGRGTAGIAGFRYALSQDVDAIMEMDADFSHDPKYIPVFLGLIRYYDVVIGSRFVEGGEQLDREFSRELISVFANKIYRFILGCQFRDISGGYKCYRKEALAALDFGDFFSHGYPVGMETIYRLYKKGFSFVEIPIVFPNRKYGASKFKMKEAWNAVAVAFKLTWRFGSSGGVRKYVRRVLGIPKPHTDLRENKGD